MHIIEYEPGYRDETVALLAELQEFERALSPDRTPGAAMASDHLDYLLTICRANSGKIFLALSGTEVAGFAVVFLESEDTDDFHLLPEYRQYGWISDLLVDRKHRGSQAAPLLMEHAERHCTALGVRRIMVSALHDNQRARHFYEKAGYGVREVVYSKDI